MRKWKGDEVFERRRGWARAKRRKRERRGEGNTEQVQSEKGEDKEEEQRRRSATIVLVKQSVVFSPIPVKKKRAGKNEQDFLPCLFLPCLFLSNALGLRVISFSAADPRESCDAGVDQGVDASVDAGVDSGTEAPRDASRQDAGALEQDEGLQDEGLSERLFFGKAVSAAISRRVFERCRLPVQGEGYIFVRLHLRSEGKTPILQAVVERNDGAPMTAADCASLSRFLSPLLEGEGLVSKQTRLEVSSPGLERPLTGLKDFRRFAGSEITLELDKQKAQEKTHEAKTHEDKTHEAKKGGEKRRFRATLLGVEGRNVVVRKATERLSIPIEDLTKAQLVAVFAAATDHELAHAPAQKLSGSDAR